MPLNFFSKNNEKKENSENKKDNSIKNKNNKNNNETEPENSEFNAIIEKIEFFDLFDENYYLTNYPDVKNSELSPLKHYLKIGFKENKNPGRIFDSNFYLKEYPDVKNSNLNPLIHYINYGKKEGRFKNKNEKNLSEIANGNNFNNLLEIANNQNNNLNLANLEEKLNEHIFDNEMVLTSYNLLFNLLILDFELKPKNILKNIQDMCTELLNFVDNVCKKYNLEYWLDYGTLLGSVRHKGYIPWDDDLDLAMMRKDYNKLLEVIKDEIIANGLEEDIEIIEKKFVNEENMVVFLKLKYISPEIPKGGLGDVDVFPYEYIDLKGKSEEETEELFNKVKSEFYLKLFKNINTKEALKTVSKDLNLNLNKEKFIIPGVDNSRGIGNYYKFKIMDNDDIFPLQNLEFENKEYPSPNNPHEYIKKIYGNDYMEIPRIVKSHMNQNNLRTIENIDEIFEKNIQKIRKVNENFKNS